MNLYDQTEQKNDLKKDPFASIMEQNLKSLANESLKPQESQNAKDDDFGDFGDFEGLQSG